MLGQVRPCQIRLCPVMTGNVRCGQVRRW